MEADTGLSCGGRGMHRSDGVKLSALIFPSLHFLAVFLRGLGFVFSQAVRLTRDGFSK